MTGNLFLILTVILFGALAKLFRGPKPIGDYAVGFSFALLVNSIGFVIASGLLVWAMQRQHCFDSILLPSLKDRPLLIAVAWVSFLISVFWSLEFHNKSIQKKFPSKMRWLTISRIHIWLPLAVFLPCFYLLNKEQLPVLPSALTKLPFKIGIFASLLMALIVLGSFGKYWLQKTLGRAALKKVWQNEREEKYQASIGYIKNYNESTVLGLLKFLDPEDEPKRRKEAMTKIKSFPHWENDLITILTKKDLEKTYVYDDDTYFVYAFLNDNTLEHPGKFIQPIKHSLNVLAKRAGKDIENPYARDLWRLNLTTVCKILSSQFKMYANEFKPEMSRLNNILNTDAPERKSKPHRAWYQKMLKTYRIAVKEWLRENQ